MITYLHVPLIGVSAAFLLLLWRSWSGIERLGLTQELARNAPGLGLVGAKLRFEDI